MSDTSKERVNAIFALTAGTSGQPFELRLDRWEWVSSRLKILVAGQWVVLEEFRASYLFESCTKLYEALRRRDDHAVLRIEWDEGRVYVSYGQEAAEPQDLSHVAELMSTVHDAVIDLDRFGADVFVLMGNEGPAGRITRDSDGNLHAYTVDGTSWRVASEPEADLLFEARAGVAALQNGDDIVFWDEDENRWQRGQFICPALNITQRGNRVRPRPHDRKVSWRYHVLPINIGQRYGIPEAAEMAA